MSVTFLALDDGGECIDVHCDLDFIETLDMDDRLKLAALLRDLAQRVLHLDWPADDGDTFLFQDQPRVN